MRWKGGICRLALAPRAWLERWLAGRAASDGAEPVARPPEKEPVHPPFAEACQLENGPRESGSREKERKRKLEASEGRAFICELTYTYPSPLKKAYVKSTDKEKRGTVAAHLILEASGGSPAVQARCCIRFESGRRRNYAQGSSLRLQLRNGGRRGGYHARGA